MCPSHFCKGFMCLRRNIEPGTALHKSIVYVKQYHILLYVILYCPEYRLEIILFWKNARESKRQEVTERTRRLRNQNLYNL
jgi:hypothetical protein